MYCMFYIFYMFWHVYDSWMTVGLPSFLIGSRAHSSGEGELIKDSSGANPRCVSKHMRYPHKARFNLILLISKVIEYYLQLRPLSFTRQILRLPVEMPLCLSHLVLMFFQVCQVRSKQRCMEPWQPSTMSRLSETPWAVGDAPLAEVPSLEPVLGLR